MESRPSQTNEPRRTVVVAGRGNSPRGHGAAQCRTAVGKDTVVSVRVARLLVSSLTGPRTFDLHQKTQQNLQQTITNHFLAEKYHHKWHVVIISSLTLLLQLCKCTQCGINSHSSSTYRKQSKNSRLHLWLGWRLQGTYGSLRGPEWTRWRRNKWPAPPQWTAGESRSD